MRRFGLQVMDDLVALHLTPNLDDAALSIYMLIYVHGESLRDSHACCGTQNVEHSFPLGLATRDDATNLLLLQLRPTLLPAVDDWNINEVVVPLTNANRLAVFVEQRLYHFLRYVDVRVDGFRRQVSFHLAHQLTQCCIVDLT